MKIPRFLATLIYTLISFFLSNAFVLAIPTEIFQKYPVFPFFFTNLTRIYSLKIVLAIIFGGILVYVKEMVIGKIFDIAIANCRSFPGFQMMGLLHNYPP